MVQRLCVCVRIKLAIRCPNQRADTRPHDHTHAHEHTKVVSNLEEDGSEWAQETLDKLRKVSPLRSVA